VNPGPTLGKGLHRSWRPTDGERWRLSVWDPVNRPVRTRMPGGVVGGAGNGPAYPMGVLMASGR